MLLQRNQGLRGQLQAIRKGRRRTLDANRRKILRRSARDPSGQVPDRCSCFGKRTLRWSAGRPLPGRRKSGYLRGRGAENPLRRVTEGAARRLRPAASGRRGVFWQARASTRPRSGRGRITRTRVQGPAEGDPVTTKMARRLRPGKTSYASPAPLWENHDPTQGCSSQRRGDAVSVRVYTTSREQGRRGVAGRIRRLLPRATAGSPRKSPTHRRFITPRTTTSSTWRRTRTATAAAAGRASAAQSGSFARPELRYNRHQRRGVEQSGSSPGS